MIAGEFKGETGFIIKVLVKEDRIVIFSDLRKNEITVAARDAIESDDIGGAMGKETLEWCPTVFTSSTISFSCGPKVSQQ